MVCLEYKHLISERLTDMVNSASLTPFTVIGALLCAQLMSEVD